MRVRRLLLNVLVSMLAVVPGCSDDDDDNAVDAADDDNEESAPNCWDAPGDAATSASMTLRLEPEYYIEQSLKYFDTLDSYADPHSIPNYSELVARWEWPPWLKLTGFGDESMIWLDLLLRLYPTAVRERDCEAFSVQPFGRCHVVFYYQERPCAIYEEFTFNDQGEMTFIEAWSDIPGLLPTTDPGDYWAEGADVHRLSTKIPGLGNAAGLIDLDSDCMLEARKEDEDVADFVKHAEAPVFYWILELLNSGDDMMRVGCEE